jgi:hypothetical protein
MYTIYEARISSIIIFNVNLFLFLWMLIALILQAPILNFLKFHFFVLDGYVFDTICFQVNVFHDFDVFLKACTMFTCTPLKHKAQ